MTTVAGKPGLGSIAARLERLPQSRWHVKVRFLIGAVTFFEAFDQLLAASALPVLIKDWHLTTGQATFAVTTGSVGMLLGALVAGWLGDRIGRVRTVALGVAVTALGSLAVAFSNGIELFSLFRFVQGLGIGGVVPVAATYINEIARSDKRGRFVLIYEMIFPAGLAAATLVAVWVVPNLGWRAMFVIGALPVLLAAALPKHVAESPRWLLSQGRTEEAEQAIARIEAEVTAATGEPLPQPAADRVEETSRGRLRELFTGRYLRRTTVVSGLWFVAYYVNHGISTWLPSLYTKNFGLDLTTALVYTLLSNVTGLLGTLCVALVIDRVGRRPALVAALGGTTFTLATLALVGVTSGSQVAIFASCTTFFVYAINAGLYLYSPELYPTRNRAKGAAFGGLWNRLGVILGPITVGAIIGGGGSLTIVFAQLAAVAAVGAVIALFAVETKGKTLEELNS
ncbi:MULTISPECIES: MFS transporter [unclassified Streptomyces]|uniref:MFS transporter n=1 Tax=unclassified Streptomyces TaxID=2593676 RepID=UPI00225BCC6F|nr:MULTISPECIES: MFS transporter [unclassified Streptomyces]MCX5436233.1 MFS transporter [Streptomyces sp. NBC_00063]WSE14018.1 MFS transporter [Streptomyces sp. NBC_01397]WUB97063.1 MFS transporter [Streptomyces sp. NBC_00569]